MADDKLNFEEHVDHFKVVFGYDSDAARDQVHKQAQCQHSLYVFDAFREFATSTVSLSFQLNTREASYYMRYGASRRLLMMWRSYQMIVFTAAPDRRNPLSDDESKLLSGAINNIYMHIRGVLDNFTWCFLYEREPKLVNELRPIDIGMFSALIRKRSAFTEFWQQIDLYRQWANELKERRDPVAHRIPLYIPHALLTPEEAEAYNQLAQRYYDRINDADFEGRKVISEQMQRIGRFVPHFIHHPEQGIVPLYPTLPNDLVHIIRIGGIIRHYIQ